MPERRTDVSAALAAFIVAARDGSGRDALGAGFTTPAYARALNLGTSLGDATLAAALVAGERAGAGAEAIAAAVAVGRETERRILAAVGDEAFARAWDVDAIGGRFGAVAAAARLGGLDAATTLHAIGIASTQAAGTAAERGTPAGALAIGKAAADALEAVALARHGFTAPAHPLEGRRGFAALLADRFDAAAILGD